MQLSGPEIQKRMKLTRFQKLLNLIGGNYTPQIIITPFDKNCIGSNSYDLHLDKILKVYKKTIPDGMLPAIKFDKNKYESSLYSMEDWFNPETNGFMEYKKIAINTIYVTQSIFLTQQKRIKKL